MKHIEQGTMEELREKLEVEREELQDELASHGRVQDETGDWTGSSAGFEGQESDPNDVADQIEELATNIPLVEELEDKHQDVEDAIERMEQGIYGKCEECDEPIPVDRLMANPSARTCIEHAV